MAERKKVKDPLLWCYSCQTAVSLPESRVWTAIPVERMLPMLRKTIKRGERTYATLCPRCLGELEVGRGRE